MKPAGDQPPAGRRQIAADPFAKYDNFEPLSNIPKLGDVPR